MQGTLKVDLRTLQQQVQELHQSLSNNFRFSHRLTIHAVSPCGLLLLGNGCCFSPQLMFWCLCLPETPFGMVWLFSFLRFTKLNNQYYVLIYLIQQIRPFCEAGSSVRVCVVNQYEEGLPIQKYCLRKQSLLSMKGSDRKQWEKME